MAYNPFDDVIDQDPAYMATGGSPAQMDREKAKEQEYLYLDPDTQMMADFDKEQAMDTLQAAGKAVDTGASFVAEGFATIPNFIFNVLGFKNDPEFKKQYEENKENYNYYINQFVDENMPGNLLPQQRIQWMQQNLPPVIKELKQYGIQKPSLAEQARYGVQSFYGDYQSATEKLRSGQKLSQLSSDELLEVAFMPIDFIDLVAFGGALKLTRSGLKAFGDLFNVAKQSGKYNNTKPTLNQLLKDEEVMAKLSPEVRADIETTFGGAPRYPDTRPPGMETSQVMYDVADRSRGSTVITPSGIKLPEGFEAPPANKNDSYRYSAWRNNTVDKILSDIKTANPGIELSQKEARAEIAKFFNKYYPETIFGTDNTKTFKLNEQGVGGKDNRKSENFFAKLNPIVNKYTKQSPGGQSIDYFTNPKTAPDYVFTASSKDPNYKGTPQYQYLNNKAEEFYKLNGERPDPGTLSNHIRLTDPEAAKNFTGGDVNPKRIEIIINNQKKTGNPNTINYVKPKKAKSIGTLIDDLDKKALDPEGLKVFNKKESKEPIRPYDFNRNWNGFLSYLRGTDSMFQTIKNGFDRFMAPFVNEFDEQLFKYTSMTKYLKKNAEKFGIDPRVFSYDTVNTAPNLKSSAKVEREVNELQTALESTGKDYRREAAGVQYNLELPEDVSRFFTFMYRSALEDAEKGGKGLISNKDFVNKYIMPYKGTSPEETVKNLKLAYPDLKQWDKMEKRFENYEKSLSDFMMGLKGSNLYDDESLKQIYASLKPNRAHDFPMITSLRKGRFVNMGAIADLIQIQPAVFNLVYQPIYDNVFKNLIKQFEGKTTLDALKKMPAKSIGDFKNSIGFDISISDFKAANKDMKNPTQYDYLNWVFQKLDRALAEKGMVSVLPFKPKQANILKGLKIDDKFVGPSTFDTPEGDTLIIGSKERFTESKKGKMSEPFSPGMYLSMAYNAILDSFAKGKRLPPETAPYKKYGSKKDQQKFILFNKGGAVNMALGGDPLQNINQQEFASDPGFDGEDYFSQAVESGNLYAFNPGKIFKNLMKTDSVFTPNKIKQSLPDVPQGPPGQTLPATQTLQPEDFAFQSFTLNKIMDKNAPKAARPQDWANYLTGGQPAPLSEIQDTGLEQYLRDFESYFPNQKITQQQLVDFYETSPIGNIEIKVKEGRNNPILAQNDPAYTGYTGKAQHQNSGSQPLDESGKDYREIVVTSGPLPGDKNPYVQSGHYQEENVLGFTRVANYEQPGGAKVAVIQEMQTDMLTKVRKEQERVQALLKRIEKMQENAAIQMGSGEAWRIEQGQGILNNLERNVPAEARKALEKFSNLIKPYPNTAAKDLIPGYAGDLSKLQDEINAVVAKDIEQRLPETSTILREISGKQEDILNKLLDLNRSSELDQVLKGVRVPATRNTDELADYANASRPTSIEPGGYGNMKDLELFPPIPFNKQADYVDLLIKSTIKDAQSKGINKVAIYPSELVNKRWGKRPDSDAGKKFRDLYDNVGQQTMKNIAKKYGGEAKFEVIIDPNKSERGLTFLQKDVDGNYFMSKQDELAGDLSFGEQQQFIDSELARAAHNMGVDSIIYSKEVAPGQTMDYWVNPTGPSQGIPRQDLTFELIPLKPGDDINSAAIRIEEYNPQEIPMFTITLDSEKAKAPMFMFKKKSGGIIDKDSLISITDIYGEYGR